MERIHLIVFPVATSTRTIPGLTTDDVCSFLVSDATSLWIIPYIMSIFFELGEIVPVRLGVLYLHGSTVTFILASFAAVLWRKRIPTPVRSSLVSVLWKDGESRAAAREVMTNGEATVHIRRDVLRIHGRLHVALLFPHAKMANDCNFSIFYLQHPAGHVYPRAPSPSASRSQSICSQNPPASSTSQRWFAVS